ncbi:DUF11 domain-containing protein [Bacillus sp. SS-TM]
MLLEGGTAITFTSNVINTLSPTARLGDTLTYSVQVTNTGTVPATNVQFSDVPSPSLEFVPGSVQINGIPQVGHR